MQRFIVTEAVSSGRNYESNASSDSLKPDV